NPQFFAIFLRCSEYPLHTRGYFFGSSANLLKYSFGIKPWAFRICVFKVFIFLPHSRHTTCFWVTISFRGIDGFFTPATSGAFSGAMISGITAPPSKEERTL